MSKPCRLSVTHLPLCSGLSRFSCCSSPLPLSGMQLWPLSGIIISHQFLMLSLLLLSLWHHLCLCLTLLLLNLLLLPPLLLLTVLC